MCNYGAWLPYLLWDSFGPQVLISDVYGLLQFTTLINYGS